MRTTVTTSLITAVLLITQASLAHVGDRPSIHDTIAGILDRMKQTLSHEEIVSMSTEELWAFLNPEEREVLSTEYLSFDVNRNVDVYVIRDARLGAQPYWLKEQGFEKTGHMVTVNRRDFDVWRKSFDAGRVGLGVNSINGAGEHYFVTLRPQGFGLPVQVANTYPGLHTHGYLKKNARPLADESDVIVDFPEEFEGQFMIRGVDERVDDTRLVNLFRLTPYPSSDKPDHVVMTWSGDPKTTQTIQWRTSTRVTKGAVAYMKAKAYNSFARPKPTIVSAETTPMETPDILNDPVIHRHTAVLTGLEPGTDYVYAVGDGSDRGWTELAKFTTAPDRVVPFSFIYMGDAQNGLERWGSLARNAFRRRPDAAFFVMAGDLVNRGNDRDDWDVFFENAQSIYAQRQLLPATGNHEYQGGSPDMYLDMFTLPDSSPVGEKAYSLEYSNAQFVVLDSNIPVSTQTEWLEEQLAGSDATWKFVVYHHPAYSSALNRNNPSVRREWGAVFDKYHVDLALQGHDHAYLRTYPMKDETPVDSPSEGTIYIVSVSGTKFYEQGDFDYTEVGFTNVSTYQTLDIQISGDRLVYRAYDTEGGLRDEFVIEK